MSRMLEALKTLETKRGDAGQSAARQIAATPRPAPVRAKETPPEKKAPDRARSLSAPPPSAPSPAGSAACILPMTLELSDAYLELAAAVSEQNSASYCNVLLVVSPEPASENGFSLARLAQAVALQSPGQVLLVDGDLRGRHLSKSVGLSGQGLSDVMSGTAAWHDVIRSSNMACVDFAGAGTRSVPTLERPEFGWNDLRPRYRVVLLGVAAAPQPETIWLAARCDAVYLLIRQRHSLRQAATAATNALRECGANVLGCIVSDD
jgi:Mrp family chromosome partitioning ATPase